LPKQQSRLQRTTLCPLFRSVQSPILKHSQYQSLWRLSPQNLHCTLTVILSILKDTSDHLRTDTRTLLQQHLHFQLMPKRIQQKSNPENKQAYLEATRQWIALLRERHLRNNGGMCY